jgi:hypothetical protein
MDDVSAYVFHLTADDRAYLGLLFALLALAPYLCAKITGPFCQYRKRKS